MGYPKYLEDIIRKMKNATWPDIKEISVINNGHEYYNLAKSIKEEVYLYFKHIQDYSLQDNAELANTCAVLKQDNIKLANELDKYKAGDLVPKETLNHATTELKRYIKKCNIAEKELIGCKGKLKLYQDNAASIRKELGFYKDHIARLQSEKERVFKDNSKFETKSKHNLINKPNIAQQNNNLKQIEKTNIKLVNKLNSI